MPFVKRFALSAAVLGWAVMPLLAQGGQQPYKVKDPGVVAPAVVKQVNPRYTDEAKEKKIQGIVELQAVVLEDGTVGDITVARSLDATYGLDEAAVAALGQWQFTPGQKDGKAVKVLVDVEMTFTLR